MKKIKNNVAIVTGGAQNLGKAISMKLAEVGAIVHIFDINDSFETVKEMTEKGYKARCHMVDVANSVEVQSAVDKVLEQDSTVDILVNCAGVVSNHENLLTVTDDIWNRELAIDLSGTFFCCRAVYKIMKDKKYGKIVNIASLAGETGRLSTSPGYSAAKAGVMGLTRSIARNGAKDGINCNVVNPGLILTSIHDNYPKEVLDKLLAEVSYVRGGKPNDIANAVLFLCTSDSDYINGASIDVNGGSYMR